MISRSVSGFLLLAQADAVPPIPVVWAVLQTLGVMVLAFVLLTLVMSHLRYQNELKRVEAEKSGGMSADDLRLWMVERIRKTPQSLVLFRCDEVHHSTVFSLLQGEVRSTDTVMKWSDEGVMLVFDGEDALNAVRAGLRLGRLLPGDIPGRVSSVVSPAPPPLKGLLPVVDGLLADLRTGALPETGWTLPEEPGGAGVHIPEHEKPLLDEVTGVLRAERVPTAVQKILASHRRREVPVCLLLCEVDDLELYAGAEGEPVKHPVLKAAAQSLMQNCRETDLVGRMTDAGFVLVLSGDVRDCAAVAVRLLDAARQTTVEVSGEIYRYTLSAGMAGYPDHGAGPQRLLSASQQALEWAKSRGRGQLVVYDPQLRATESRAREPGESPETF